MCVCTHTHSFAHMCTHSHTFTTWLFFLNPEYFVIYWTHFHQKRKRDFILPIISLLPVLTSGLQPGVPLCFLRFGLCVLHMSQPGSTANDGTAVWRPRRRAHFRILSVCSGVSLCICSSPLLFWCLVSSLCSRLVSCVIVRWSRFVSPVSNWLPSLGSELHLRAVCTR